MNRGLKYNGSGCMDLTAYQAIINISKKNVMIGTQNLKNKREILRKEVKHEYCKNEEY